MTLLTLGWIGLYAPLALGAVGSMIGCLRGGTAACGAMLEVESGLVGLSALRRCPRRKQFMAS